MKVKNNKCYKSRCRPPGAVCVWQAECLCLCVCIFGLVRLERVVQELIRVRGQAVHKEQRSAVSSENSCANLCVCVLFGEVLWLGHFTLGWIVPTSCVFHYLHNYSVYYLNYNHILFPSMTALKWGHWEQLETLCVWTLQGQGSVIKSYYSLVPLGFARILERTFQKINEPGRGPRCSWSTANGNL